MAGFASRSLLWSPKLLRRIRRRPGGKEQRAGSRGRRAGGGEQGAGSRGLGARSKEQGREQRYTIIKTVMIWNISGLRIWIYGK